METTRRGIANISGTGVIIIAINVSVTTTLNRITFVIGTFGVIIANIIVFVLATTVFRIAGIGSTIIVIITNNRHYGTTIDRLAGGLHTDVVSTAGNVSMDATSSGIAGIIGTSVVVVAGDNV
jgi:hypothetical protein